ncbi:MAG: NUDIX domain-containing protein [Angustibacter sp.]
MLAAGLVVRSTHGRVLLAEPKTKPRWDVVGGIVEAGESVVAAARREALEEVGVALPVGNLLAVDLCRATADRPETMCFLLDGGVHDESLTGAFSYPDGEVVRAHWVEPTEVVEPLRPADRPAGHRGAGRVRRRPPARTPAPAGERRPRTLSGGLACMITPGRGRGSRRGLR